MRCLKPFGCVPTFEMRNHTRRKPRPKTVSIKVWVEWVDETGFHLLSKRKVKLTFPEGTGVFPLPKHEKAEDALRTQHPRLWAKIPTVTDSRGFTSYRGLCFS